MTAYLDTLKARLTAWYNRRIVAQWYKSAALIGGWLTSLILFAPNIAQFVVDHWDFFGPVVLPKFDTSTQAIVLGVYTTFVAPPLRAWVQKTMQQALIKQQAEAGKVVPLAASGLPGGFATVITKRFVAPAETMTVGEGGSGGLIMPPQESERLDVPDPIPRPGKDTHL